MKKINILVTAILLSFFSFSTMPAISSNVPVINKTDSVEAMRLLERIKEINTMDTEQLPVVEKKKLRKEVKNIKSRLEQLNNGVYISAGALLVIIILLIIIL